MACMVSPNTLSLEARAESAAGNGVQSCPASVRTRFDCALYEYQTRPAAGASQS